MKKTNTIKKIFTFFLALMLIGVQCLGAVTVNAENGSVSYNFDEWEPVPVTDTEGAEVEGAYQPPTGWTGVSPKFSATNYYYKEDGAMGYYYKRSGSTLYNNGLKTDLPSGIDKNDFLIDYALYKKSFSNESFAILDTGSSFKWSKAFSTSENKWQQISARFVKNSGKYTALIYVNGALSAKEENLSFDPGKFGIYSRAIYENGIINILLDNVNIRNTPTTLSVTPSVADGAQNVATDAALTYALSQDMDKDTLLSVKIKDAAGKDVAANAGYDYRTKTIALKPALNLNTTYTVDFSGVKDVIGNSAERASYTFTTAKEKVYVNETFDTYNPTSGGGTFPTSTAGRWGYNASDANLTMTGGDGAFTFAHTNTNSQAVYPEMKFTLNSSVDNKALLFEMDYKVISGGGCVIKLNDTSTSTNIYTDWGSQGQNKLQAVFSGNNADVYVNGTRKGTVSASSGWKGKVGAIIISPIVYGNGTTKIAVDNIRLATQPTELNVTSSLDTKSENLSLGESITFTFDNALKADTAETAAVTANGTNVGEAEYSAAAKTITFKYDAVAPLAENTTYTVDLSGVRDIFGNTPKTTSYTFKTVEKAGVSIDEASFSVKEGDSDVATAGYLGGEVTATVNAVNTSLADSKVMVAIAVYNKDFSILKAVRTGVANVLSGAAPTAVSAVLPALDDYKDGDCIKVFVLNAGTLMPFKPAFAANSDGEIVKPN